MSSRASFLLPKDEEKQQTKYIFHDSEQSQTNNSNNNYHINLELPPISKKTLSSSSSISADSLQSTGIESLPASYCDTDAALFQFDYEMLEEDGVDEDVGNSSETIPIKRRIQKNGYPKDQDVDQTEAEKVDHDLDKKELILFGIDLSHLSSVHQFAISSCGVLFFNMIYGYLQELIQIRIAGRSFALFLGACQFFGYAFWSYVFAKLRARLLRLRKRTSNDGAKRVGGQIYSSLPTKDGEENVAALRIEDDTSPAKRKKATSSAAVGTYFALSVIRAIDLGLTNLSMKYLNYPAKTLIKSSRVIFTMFLGLFIGKKKYKKSDYAMVLMLVIGLALFLHADMHTSAVFHPVGVTMLATSLILDATVSNWSELIMKKHNMGQDDFQMKLYSFSFLIMLTAAYQTDELWSGIKFFFLSDGTYNEFLSEGMGESQYTWTRKGKSIAVILFSTLGIFGGSCAAAITKRFGALTMSITTTTRKAATIFLSFAMFNNECTPEHIMGVSIFVLGLLLKGARNHIVVPRAFSWCLPKAMLPRPFQRS